MVNYKDGKIYRLVNKDSGLIYYGATCVSLSKRFSTHKSQYKLFNTGRIPYCPTSFAILKTNNYDIELIEKYPCNNRAELYQRERYYIENNECINKKIPFRHDDEKEKIRKEYYSNNKEAYKRYYKKNIAKIKKYITENRDKYLESSKNYYLNHKKEHNEYYAEYYKRNKDKLLQKYHTNKQKIICECGSSIYLGSQKSHRESFKHIKFVNNKNI